MAGGIVRYNKYICPHCGSSLSNASIVMVQAKGICPKCDEPLNIDASQALPQTGQTLFTSAIVFALYFLVIYGKFSIFQVNIESFFRELHPSATILAIVLIILLGAVIAQWAEQSEVKSCLKLAQEIRDEESMKAGD